MNYQDADMMAVYERLADRYEREPVIVGFLPSDGKRYAMVIMTSRHSMSKKIVSCVVPPERGA